MELLGVRVENGKPVGDFDTFTIDDLYFAEAFQPKANHILPLFHTRKGTFTVLTTLEEHYEAFSKYECIKLIDSRRFANINNIEYARPQGRGAIAYFKDYHIPVPVSRDRKKNIRHLMTKSL
ncbi:LytTR family transcriptional regulator DNA-binding domain-containing protein [Paenibacillus alvei]|uniref:LytTR family transcriptional regulator DNA-binding domain-containing protein n=1 Tax=Paenibacillus alvei TaxID=44250 RepID=A0ABT4GZJ0_PAEAL|nr:hypothetical protein [Paenibacillus alvei]EJW14655.1 hypothetical protein PAV_12c01180 [Paenibacillus alvei DSM 29]MCY9542727.1 LytTR family transcriptional regulator DNA-binding domain-containing protein [Paenibacillus alvei]MCY9708045.1 LytTR family transcriptional regulator DNA-binding domain-containing protein [Paenibacillus alvei]MCY9733867.1 LytTR family transcriptional regulator DNA-binding domain-containing protein [Paenibacillus alvei]MCY9758516.1 LytTR family transcriptional regul